MTFAQFVVWLASSAALGAVSSLAFQLIKKFVPSLHDTKAKILSVAFAALVSIVAQQLVPLLPQMPEVIEQLWPIIVWMWSQLMYGTATKRMLPA